MKKKSTILALIIVTAAIALPACFRDTGRNDTRDRNIEKAMLSYLDSIPGTEYIGLSDTRDLADGNFQAVIIYNVPDSTGNKVERNARVITNGDGSEIYSWDELDCHILEDVKQKVSDKFEEKGIGVDGSLIDALIALKRR